MSTHTFLRPLAEPQTDEVCAAGKQALGDADYLWGVIAVWLDGKRHEIDARRVRAIADRIRAAEELPEQDTKSAPTSDRGDE